MIILISLFIIMIICIVVKIFETNKACFLRIHYQMWAFLGWASFDGLCCCGLVMLTSYVSYLDCRSFYDSSYKQYKNQITLYQEKSKIDTKIEGTYTDLKYQKYQDAMSEKITTFTEKVTSYNESIIKKREMKKNKFISWLIIGPDDDMKELIVESK